jgi:hypothetical protein
MAHLVDAANNRAVRQMAAAESLLKHGLRSDATVAGATWNRRDAVSRSSRSRRVAVPVTATIGRGSGSAARVDGGLILDDVRVRATGGAHQARPDRIRYARWIGSGMRWASSCRDSVSVIGFTGSLLIVIPAVL